MGQGILDDLREAYAEMQEHHAAGDNVAMTQADARFHRIIAETSSNQAVAHVFDQLEPFARTFITLTLPSADVGSIIREHGDILAALEQGEPVLAATHARAHQLNVSALFRDHFELETVGEPADGT